MVITKGSWPGPLCSRCGLNNPQCRHGFYDKNYPIGGYKRGDPRLDIDKHRQWLCDRVYQG